jgi:nucleoid-associated protein
MIILQNEQKSVLAQKSCLKLAGICLKRKVAMKVNRMIIHNLKKEQQEKAELIISDTVLDPKDKKVISIIEELNSRFRTNIIQGVFSKQSGNENTFQKGFNIYLKTKKPAIDERFTIMAKNTINMLYNRIDTISAAKGGYVLYTDYEPTANRHYFSIFLIRDVTGKVFEFNKNTITIEEVIHADTANLAMACRINIEKYKNLADGGEEDSYLNFISIKQPETSGYFLDWIGAERKKRNRENTKNFVTIITRIDPPLGEDGKPVDRNAFFRQVYDAVKTFGTNDINVNSLSTIIFGDETTIMEYADEHDIELATEFYADSTILKRLLSHTAEGDNIRLRYPPTYYRDKIKIDETTPDTIIIKSKALVDAILREENK